MSKNGMATYDRTVNYVNLTHLPTPKKEYTVNFEKLTGGLNLYAPDYRLNNNESPDMENMLWKNGTLCSRYGQNYTEPNRILPIKSFVFTGAAPRTTITLIERPADIVSVIVSGTTLEDTEWSWDYDKTVTLVTGASSGTIMYRPCGYKNGEGYTCFEELFWGNAFFHIGTKLFYAEPSDDMTLTDLCDLRQFYGDSYTPSRGTFLRYGEDLFYKALGVFVRIHYTGSTFTVSDVAAGAFTPTTYVNASWRNGSGDSYQPENRLNPKKTIWYNAGTEEKVETFSGTGAQTDFVITTSDFVYITDVTVDGASKGNWNVYYDSGQQKYVLSFYVSPNTWEVTNGDMHLIDAPPAGTDNIVVTMQCAVKTYYLPVKDPTIPASLAIDKIEVQTAGVWAEVQSTDYTFDPATGLITFDTAPEVTQPLSSNTVRVTYTWPNSDYTAAYNSIMDCPYAIVFGGNQNICMIVGGCKAQPNAFFWNGNNVAMDITYWPMEQYNLGGDTEDAITGFGRQQGQLVVFKNRSVGKVSMDLTTVENKTDTTNRVYIEMDYTQINSKIGCDLPWTIQLIDNNLVFCNSEQGVHYVKDSSSAYENNIICVSTKVNGDNGRIGLLEWVRKASLVSSFDDEKRYWLIADSKVFCWDYELSEVKDPSWFYLSGIDAPALFRDVDTIYHIDSHGRVVVFDTSYADFGKEFERRYQFATQYFGSYERLKTVTDMYFTFRADTDFNITVTYKTDYEIREDMTDIVHRGWKLVPRNLMYRDLSVEPFAHAERRRPGCRHVRHFAAVLRCTGVGQDMPILSAQVSYKYEGRDR